MITKSKILSEEKFTKNFINKDLNYFSYYEKYNGQNNLTPTDSFLVMVWEGLKDLYVEKKFLMFCFAMGSVFECLIYNIAHSCQIQVYQSSGKGNLLKSKGVLYQSERSTKSDLNDIIECLDSKYKNQRFTQRGFGQKPWNLLECFKYVMNKQCDDWSYGYLLVLLRELRDFRNAFSHGNIQQFIKKKFSDHIFDDFLQVEFDNETGISEKGIEKVEIPFIHAPDLLILKDLFDEKGVNNEKFDIHLRKIFVHLSFILHETYLEFVIFPQIKNI